MWLIFNYGNALWTLEKFLANPKRVRGDDNGKDFSSTKEVTYLSGWCLWSLRFTFGLLLLRKVGYFEDV